MAKIAIIDDDMAMDILVDALRYNGQDALRLKSAKEALNRLDELTACDLIILDIIMPWPTRSRRKGVHAPRTAGMEVLVQLRAKRRDLPVIALSATQDESIVSAIKSDRRSTFLSKWNGHTIQDIIERITQTLHLERLADGPRVFIVHGHDETAKLQLKNYLQNTLKYPEPTILHEQPNRGRTIIEKFEDFAAASSVVFVLLTPDDAGAAITDTNEQKHRARQNVIFELGFFLGRLGRQSGKVILLHKGAVELPSDIAGLVYIDITAGIEAAGELIRREVQHVR
jgi:predicted nucleotide-binding protein